MLQKLFHALSYFYFFSGRCTNSRDTRKNHQEWIQIATSMCSKTFHRGATLYLLVSMRNVFSHFSLTKSIFSLPPWQAPKASFCFRPNLNMHLSMLLELCWKRLCIISFLMKLLFSRKLCIGFSISLYFQYGISPTFNNISSKKLWICYLEYSVWNFIQPMDHWLWTPDSFKKDIKNSFHGVTQMGLEPHQIFFQNFFQQLWSLEELKVFAY